MFSGYIDLSSNNNKILSNQLHRNKNVPISKKCGFFSLLKNFIFSKRNIANMCWNFTKILMYDLFKYAEK